MIRSFPVVISVTPGVENVVSVSGARLPPTTSPRVTLSSFHVAVWLTSNNCWRRTTKWSC